MLTESAKRDRAREMNVRTQVREFIMFGLSKVKEERSRWNKAIYLSSGA